MNNKKAVVLMAVYNEQEYIDEAIQSFLLQKNVNATLVVIDDLSEDNTFQIAKKYESEKVVVLKNTKKGKNNAYNLGFEMVKGDYYCFFGGDDILTENSINSRVAAISQSKNKKVALKSRIVTFSKNKKFDGVIIPKNNRKGNNSGGAVMISNELANGVFPIPISLPNEDAWTGLHIDNFAKEIIVIDDIVLKYRIHAGNSVGISSNFETRTKKINSRRKVFRLFLDSYSDVLNTSEIQRLSSIIKLENYRFHGDFFSVLFKNKASMKDKIAAIFHMNATLYKIKNLMYKIITGLR
ncbi:glycosyltransferase [Tenacibaculum sp. ZH5_bin.1]|uniref:glycosyltransferase n=1 Tax=Tenacibaculum TaxID=104267 RepID=UPI00142FC747|nr:glycosyltransferase [Tenacibaculum mesophilum]KAF9658586.1 glycosyltransferase [Tenacibaculum mesophilum]